MMRNKKRPKKPTGELGSLRVGTGSAKYRRQQWPSEKLAIEEVILQRAIRVANLYGLTQPPRHNEEDDFDYTLTTTRGQEDLDLMEAVLRLGKGGYGALPASYDISEMVAAILEGIRHKSRRYGRAARPLHLLIYSTDWRFSLLPSVVDALAAAVAHEKHIFTTITYFLPDDHARGTVELVFPRQGGAQLVPAGTDRSVVFGDIRRAEVQEDGTTSVPMPVHSEESATIQNLFVNCISSHAINHIHYRKNQANGNLSICVTGSGQFEDLTGSDILVAGDDTALVLEPDCGGPSEFGVLAVERETGRGRG